MQLTLSIITCVALLTQSAIGCSFVFNRQQANPPRSKDDKGYYVSANCAQSCHEVRPNYWFLSTLRKLMCQAENRNAQDAAQDLIAGNGLAVTPVVRDGGDDGAFSAATTY